MRKIIGLERQDTAVGFLRVVQPLRFLKREGIVDETRILPFSGSYEMQKIQFSDKVLMTMAKGADVMLTDIIYKDEDFLRIMNLRKWANLKWVIDLDDNIFQVQKDNPAYEGLQAALPNMQRSLASADGISVSVPSLKKIYEPLNKNIFVNPNGTDFSWWDTFSIKPHKGIRIGWRGAAGHNNDRALVEPAIRALCKQYKDVKFVVFQQFDPKYDFPYEWQPFVPYFGEGDEKKHSPDYPEVLANLNLDIAVVPLVDNSYNRGKSNLAYQEYASLKIPTVLSPIENQNDSKALFARTNFEWYNQLEKLILDKSLRRSVGMSGYYHIKDSYNMEKLIYPFADWLEKLPRRSDLEPELFKA